MMRRVAGASPPWVSWVTCYPQLKNPAKKSPTTLKVGHPQFSTMCHSLTPTTVAHVDLHPSPPPGRASWSCAGKKGIVTANFAQSLF